MISKTNTNKCVLAAASLVREWQREHGEDKARLRFIGNSPQVVENVGYRGDVIASAEVVWTIAEDDRGQVWASTAIDMICITDKIRDERPILFKGILEKETDGRNGDVFQTKWKVGDVEWVVSSVSHPGKMVGARERPETMLFGVIDGEIDFHDRFVDSEFLSNPSQHYQFLTTAIERKAI